MQHDLVQYADAVIALITALGLDSTVAAACPATWEQAGHCLRSAEAAEQLLGYRLALDALGSTPGAADALIARLAAALAGQAWA